MTQEIDQEQVEMVDLVEVQVKREALRELEQLVKVMLVN